jgi:hypothetical protein
VIYCPRCGDALSMTASGYMTCPASGMQLSNAMVGLLGELVAAKPTTPPAGTIKIGGRWHCPADAQRMFEDHGRIGCPMCGRYLTPKIWYGLIEYHVHPYRTE